MDFCWYHIIEGMHWHHFQCASLLLSQAEWKQTKTLLLLFTLVHLTVTSDILLYGEVGFNLYSSLNTVNAFCGYCNNPVSSSVFIKTLLWFKSHQLRIYTDQGKHHHGVVSKNTEIFIWRRDGKCLLAIDFCSSFLPLRGWNGTDKRCLWHHMQTFLIHYSWY